MLVPYYYNQTILFYIGYFGNYILIQSEQNIHPLSYQEQLNSAIEQYACKIDKENIVVIFDMTNYGSENFDMVYNKTTKTLKRKIDMF